jgi:arginine decarboxylase
LGISAKELVGIYKSKIKKNKKVSLVMMHFFINSKIKDGAYYRSELSRLVEVYCDLKYECDTLQSLDIGGGFPIYTYLDMEYDYAYMIDQIVWTIQHICDANDIPTPDIVSEFGSYTVGESGAIIYKIIGQKQQNEKELWYMINSSFITTLPDTWGIGQKFIMLPLNHRQRPYLNVNLGGITCDSDDYYNKDNKGNQIILPKPTDNQPLYIGFFHTGAYQDSIGGY